MYNKKTPNATSIKRNEAYIGVSIEKKLERILNNNEPLTEGAQIIYTERKDGVNPAMDIRTDRWEYAVEARDKTARSSIATREQAMMGMGMQLQLLKAQKENIEADTQLKQADAEKTSGVDTGLARTQIMQLTAGVDNIRAETALKQVQTTIGNIEASIKGRTEEDAVRAVGWAAEKTMQEMESLRFQNNITDETWKVKVGIIKTELIHLLLSNQQIAAQTTLTETQTRQVANSIYQKWQELEIGLRGVSTQEKRQKEDAWRNDVQESTKLPFQILDDVIDGILRKGMRGPRNTYREGSNSRGDYWESTQHY